MPQIRQFHGRSRRQRVSADDVGDLAAGDPAGEVGAAYLAKELLREVDRCPVG